MEDSASGRCGRCGRGGAADFEQPTGRNTSPAMTTLRLATRRRRGREERTRAMLKNPRGPRPRPDDAADRLAIFAHAEAFCQPRQPAAALARPEADPPLPLRAALRLRGSNHQACDGLEMAVVRRRRLRSPPSLLPRECSATVQESPGRYPTCSSGTSTSMPSPRTGSLPIGESLTPGCSRIFKEDEKLALQVAAHDIEAAGHDHLAVLAIEDRHAVNDREDTRH